MILCSYALWYLYLSLCSLSLSLSLSFTLHYSIFYHLIFFLIYFDLLVSLALCLGTKRYILAFPLPLVFPISADFCLSFCVCPSRSLYSTFLSSICLCHVIFSMCVSVSLSLCPSFYLSVFLSSYLSLSLSLSLWFPLFLFTSYFTHDLYSLSWSNSNDFCYLTLSQNTGRQSCKKLVLSASEVYPMICGDSRFKTKRLEF